MKVAILLTIITLLGMEAPAQQQAHITEQLLYGTVRLETKKGSVLGNGTGFYFTFTFPEFNNAEVHCIITNKHVLDNFDSLVINFVQSTATDQPTRATIAYQVPIDARLAIRHPGDVDLVAIPINGMLTEMFNKGYKVYFRSNAEIRIPSDSQSKERLKAIEDVLMIGYPRNLYDKVNNLPIVRKGVTATAPYNDYNGRSEFLIDLQVYGGSSGSPVFYYQEFYSDKNYTPKYGPKLYLLGIVYAVELFTINGVVVKAPPSEIQFGGANTSSIPCSISDANGNWACHKLKNDPGFQTNH